MRFRSQSTPTIVQPGAKRGRWLALAVVLVLLLSVGWFGYNHDRFYPDFDVTGALAEIAVLKQQVQTLEAERAGLRQQVAALERSSQIDREAALRVREEIKAIQEERLTMEQELDFLRRIVSNGSGKQGVRIQNFRLEPGEEEAVYRYSYTVSQAFDKAVAITGKILMTLDGKQNGEVKKLTLDALAGNKERYVTMSFKHFQDIEGVLRLPQGFVVGHVIIDILPDGEKISPLKKTFKWIVKG